MARALGLADQVGSLQVGKQADIQLIRATDINLAGGSYDPIATIVIGAHPGNVDTVLVAGEPVKRHGRLLHPALTEPSALCTRISVALSPDRRADWAHDVR